MTIMSDARAAAERRLRRQRSYANYKSQVLEDRQAVCEWVVNALVRRYRADLKRSKTRTGFLAWLRKHNTLELTYSRVFGMSTRRNWVRRQMNLLFDDSMRLFEDIPSHRQETVRLLESLLNAKHGSEEWVIRVSTKRVEDYTANHKQYKGYYTVRFDFDRRVPDHS